MLKKDLIATTAVVIGSVVVLTCLLWEPVLSLKEDYVRYNESIMQDKITEQVIEVYEDVMKNSPKPVYDINKIEDLIV
ncbi:MAG TPA: hypothetical protein ENH46_03340 [Candidatus Pacearchaeota archaeon]|nr:hypothetical protein [Candidatus Pacearchaeota archaeon]